VGKIQVHNAIVTRNVESDDQQTLLLRGSVYFEAPTLFNGEFPIPAEPCFPFASAPNGAGFFFVPKVGDEIEVLIQAHDPNTPFDCDDIENPEPRWRCMIYSKAADIADEFRKNYPFRMGWKTNSGHILMFDDLENFHEVALKHTLGHILQMTNFIKGGDQTLNEVAVKLGHSDGHFLQFMNKDKGGEVFMKLFHAIGNLLHWDKDGNWFETIVKDQIISITGDGTETVGGKKTFNITGDCEINCANAKIMASGNIEATAGGNAIIMASQIQLNGSASEATSKASHLGVIDLITGAPIVPTTTVFLDV